MQLDAGALAVIRVFPTVMVVESTSRSWFGIFIERRPGRPAALLHCFVEQLLYHVEVKVARFFGKRGTLQLREPSLDTGIRTVAEAFPFVKRR
ncbi:hypothetical protein NLX67_06840 [Domibacillus sp. A3M-37]|uniref:hypothetical protein n=1 Tax=Domibacillus sp. A3M-37 TaxID=2962037 RepID=UPI0020B6DD0C|nr:hypothetical protein [Domibacillus sp. A3M-37]MCP3762103.1 hypothetical protein [Domibacillus sp. A3M-37]